jgi:hypothetical protein
MPGASGSCAGLAGSEDVPTRNRRRSMLPCSRVPIIGWIRPGECAAGACLISCTSKRAVVGSGASAGRPMGPAGVSRRSAPVLREGIDGPSGTARATSRMRSPSAMPGGQAPRATSRRSSEGSHSTTAHRPSILSTVPTRSRAIITGFMMAPAGHGSRPPRGCAGSPPPRIPPDQRWCGRP